MAVLQHQPTHKQHQANDETACGRPSTTKYYFQQCPNQRTVAATWSQQSRLLLLISSVGGILIK